MARKRPKLLIVITAVHELPPEYFTRESVIGALQKEVAKDIRANQPVPSGVAVYPMEA